MSFVLINAPIAFIDLMNKIFRPYLERFVVGYTDDIFIDSKDRDQHIAHLWIVLQTLGNTNYITN